MAALAVRLSKIDYYLVDNIYVCILSRVMERVQVESGVAGDRFPDWESKDAQTAGCGKTPRPSPLKSTARARLGVRSTDANLEHRAKYQLTTVRLAVRMLYCPTEGVAAL